MNETRTIARRDEHLGVVEAHHADTTQDIEAGADNVEPQKPGEFPEGQLGPRGGGLEIQHGGKEILLITPQSPIGQLLIGRKAGDRVKFGAGAQQMEYRVLAVS